MLRQRDVVPYLVEHDLLTSESVVAGDIEVDDASRRNRNFALRRQDGPSYLVKHGRAEEGRPTVEHEAAVYRHLVATEGIGDLLPSLYHWDPARRVLVIELIRDGRDLHEHHARHGRFPRSLAAACGRALARLHEGTAAQLGGRAPASEPPWFLSIHHPTVDWLRELSAANVELIKVVQCFPALCEAIDALRADWRGDALVHGDLKWANCVVYPAPGASRVTRLKLVDWELAQWGDRCVDVGSVFSDYLAFWLASIPATGQLVPERFAALARYPIGRMQPAMRAFWDAYVRHSQAEGDVAREWLIRSVRYAAARLVYHGFEQGQRAPALTGTMICTLQVAHNMLQRPVEASAHLLGLAWPTGEGA